jgi:hypothetical protein
MGVAAQLSIPPSTNWNNHVKKPIVFVLSTTLLLAGCVSPQSQSALSTLQAQCAGGNRDACTAAGFQGQANQRELSNNTAVAAGVGAALLGAAVVGTAITVDSNHRYYAPEYRHDRFR